MQLERKSKVDPKIGVHLEVADDHTWNIGVTYSRERCQDRRPSNKARIGVYLAVANNHCSSEREHRRELQICILDP